MNRLTVAVVAGLLALPAMCPGQEVIWDYGPQTGPAGGCWQNIAESQNFAELVTFDDVQRVNGFQLFTCIDGINGLTFEFKILADNGGQPGAEITRFQLTNREQLLEGGQQRYDFAFDDVPLDAGSYWVGMAGVGFEAGQSSISPGPGDTQMAQFQGTGFSFFTSVGDQMFRLLGPSIEECYADFDGNGVLDLFDFLAYVNEFNAGGDTADCNDDGLLDLFDFLCFVNGFNAGC